MWSYPVLLNMVARGKTSLSGFRPPTHDGSCHLYPIPPVFPRIPGMCYKEFSRLQHTAYLCWLKRSTFCSLWNVLSAYSQCKQWVWILALILSWFIYNINVYVFMPMSSQNVFWYSNNYRAHKYRIVSLFQWIFFSCFSSIHSIFFPRTRRPQTGSRPPALQQLKPTTFQLNNLIAF